MLKIYTPFPCDQISFPNMTEYGSPANIPTLFQGCLLVDMASRCDTISNKGWNNVVYFNVKIYNFKQRRINVVFSTLMWATLDNIQTTLSFQRRVSQRWSTWKRRFENDHFYKKQKKFISNLIHWIQSFCCYFIIFFTLLPILSRICWRILAKSQKLVS